MSDPFPYTRQEAAYYKPSEFPRRASVGFRLFMIGVAGFITFCIVMAVHAARAEGYIVSCDTSVGVTCFAGPLTDPYIRQVPQPTTADEKAAAALRDKLWVERCKPSIVFDRYGVGRYQYIAAGCEFGR